MRPKFVMTICEVENKDQVPPSDTVKQTIKDFSGTGRFNLSDRHAGLRPNDVVSYPKE